MKGEYKIRLWDSRVSYNLLVNRKVTVVSGVSYLKAKINLYFIKNRRKVLSELEISDELWR